MLLAALAVVRNALRRLRHLRLMGVVLVVMVGPLAMAVVLEGWFVVID